jgi:hypothetical protein
VLLVLLLALSPFALILAAACAWCAAMRLCMVARFKDAVSLAASCLEGAVSIMILPAGVRMCSSELNSWS